MARNHGEPRLDFDPLERVFAASGEPLWRFMGGSTIHRYRRMGIPLSRADEWACRLGMHPCELWGDAWWEA